MIPNDEGVKALHWAAQGNQAVMIYYLVKIRNLDIEDKDSSGNTPLHWAVFAGSENSVNFLLALKANPNSMNNDILTPLHLSVKSIEDHGSDRIIKSLLLEGANRAMIDMDHKMAIDYVELVKDPYISNDLIHILSNPKSWQWCMLRTPLKKVRRSKKVLIQFQFLISLNWVLLILVLYPYENISLFITHVILAVLLLIISLILSIKDPGYIK